MTRGCGWALLLGALGCARPPPDPFPPAEAHYRALVAQGKPPQDPGFQDVLGELARVEQGAPSYPRAQALRTALEQARGPRPVPPLVAAPSVSESALAQKQVECVGLARTLGSARGEERTTLSRKLAECGRQAEALREAQHPHAP